MCRSIIAAIIVAGCSSPGAGTFDGSVDGAVTLDAGVRADAAAPDAEPVLDPTSGVYHEACDGSGGVAVDPAHLLAIDDEDQVMAVFVRGADAGPVQIVDISAGLGLVVTDEADLEDLARLGDRVYVISSHGRDTSGDLQPSRYRFAALDLAGAVPDLGITVAGVSTTLLDEMLDPASWDAPDAALIARLDASSQLDDPHDPDLPPEEHGTNIEGLAVDPAPGNPGRLAIGFRNPQRGGRAIVVTLENPDAVVAGQPARFGGAAELDLGGLGIRGMAWSAAHGEILILAGSHASGGPFQLYRWTGDLAAAPVLITELAAPPLSAPEAIVPYPGTHDVEITFDMGDADVGGMRCKDAPIATRWFTDVIVHVE